MSDFYTNTILWLVDPFGYPRAAVSIDGKLEIDQHRRERHTRGERERANLCVAPACNYCPGKLAFATQKRGNLRARWCTSATPISKSTLHANLLSGDH